MSQDLTTTDPATAGGRWRLRWAALGAAVAVAVGAVATSGTTPLVDAITTSGERAIYTPITPCRLADTRPEPIFNVGPRSTPLGPAETHTFAARGDQGQCTAGDLPADAVALALNVTVPTATANGFLTIWPDGPRPNASSLNPAPGAPPAPNAVASRLSSTGSFNVYNENGFTHVIIDVVGIYTDHNHDDRYYTEAEIDAAFDQRKELQLPVAGALLNGSATYDRAFSGAGIELPDTGTPEQPQVTFSFVLPADYTPGVQFFVELMWSINQVGCEVEILRNFDAIARAGELPANGDLQDQVPTPSPGANVVTTSTFIWAPGVFGAQPGDAVNVGFYRRIADACTGTVTLHGARVEYR